MHLFTVCTSLWRSGVWIVWTMDVKSVPPTIDIRFFKITHFSIKVWSPWVVCLHSMQSLTPLVMITSPEGFSLVPYFSATQASHNHRSGFFSLCSYIPQHGLFFRSTVVEHSDRGETKDGGGGQWPSKCQQHLEDLWWYLNGCIITSLVFWSRHFWKIFFSVLFYD